MKLLWIVNTIFPYPSKKLNLEKNVFGGWLLSLCEEISKNNDVQEFAIVTTYIGKELLKFKDNKNIYYLIPVKSLTKYDNKVTDYLKMIYEEFSPDLVHIHGTEFPHSLSGVNACKEKNIKNIVSIQGIISKIGDKKVYYGGMSLKDNIFNITLRDLIKKDLLINQAKKFLKRGKYEIDCLKKCDCIVGRTSWDMAAIYNIVGNDKYKKCNESLRKTFYDYNWNISKIERNSIFISQASYPVKGFHNVLKAAAIIKRKYPYFKIYVAGPNIVKNKNSNFKDRIKLSGYGKFIKKTINNNNLQENVVFVGLLDEKEMVNTMLKCHVFVQSSSIENSSNALGEAMLLGMPCVASYVGGTSDLLLDKVDGLLYPFSEYEMLAKYIIDLFNDDSRAINFGKNASKHAENTHSLYNNYNDMISIYKEVVGK